MAKKKKMKAVTKVIKRQIKRAGKVGKKSLKSVKVSGSISIGKYTLTKN